MALPLTLCRQCRTTLRNSRHSLYFSKTGYADGWSAVSMAKMMFHSTKAQRVVPPIVLRTKLAGVFRLHNKVPPTQRRMFSSQSGKQSGSFYMPWWQRLLLVGGMAGAGYYVYRSAEHEKELDSERTRYKEFAKAKLGGDWTLTDHEGKKQSSTAFRGQWLLIYFGFTHCPDICPEELEKLADLVKMIDDDSTLPNMQPLFISLDPERDTPALIKEYLKGFKNPRMIGFTGTLEEITVVAKQFRAYFGKGQADEDNDYIIDHTIIIYLINPEGEFVNYFDRSNTAEGIKKTVTKHVQLYNELQNKKKA